MSMTRETHTACVGKHFKSVFDTDDAPALVGTPFKSLYTEQKTYARIWARSYYLRESWSLSTHVRYEYITI